MYIPDLTNRKGKLIEVCVYSLGFILVVASYIFWGQYQAFNDWFLVHFLGLILFFLAAVYLGSFFNWWSENHKANKVNIILGEMLAEKRKENSLSEGPEMIPFQHHEYEGFRKRSSRWVTDDPHTDDSWFPKKLALWLRRKRSYKIYYVKDENEWYPTTLPFLTDFRTSSRSGSFSKKMGASHGTLENLPETWAISWHRVKILDSVDRFEEALECLKEAMVDLEQDRQLHDLSMPIKPNISDYDQKYDSDDFFKDPYSVDSQKYFDEISKMSESEMLDQRTKELRREELKYQAIRMTQFLMVLEDEISS